MPKMWCRRRFCALRYGDSFTGQNPRAWLFAIVRNTWFSMRKGNIPAETAV